MKFFRQRIRPVENLTFVAMVVAFDAILSLIAALLPLSAIFIMLIAPLGAAAVSIFCKKRYIVIYLLAAIGISIAVTAWEIMTALFYMIPALVTGITYGLLKRVRVPDTLNICLLALLSFAFFYLSILLIRGLLGVDMVEFLLNLIRRSGDEVARIIFPLFILGYSFAQVGIVHAFLSYELKRLGIAQEPLFTLEKWSPLISATFLILAFTLGFFPAKTAYFMFGLGIYWSICSIENLFPKPHPLTILCLILVPVIGILTFASLYRYMPNQSGLLVLSIPVLLLSLTCLLNIPLKKLQKKKE